MVYLKRYGFKFYPPDGQNATFSITRGFALGGSILLAFLFSGIDVPVVLHSISVGILIFFSSLIGEKWRLLGVTLNLCIVTAFLVMLVEIQFSGLGRHQGIGLLYLYCGAVAGLTITDLLRSQGRELFRSGALGIVLMFVVLAVIGFAPLDKAIAAIRTTGPCWVEDGSRWRPGQFHLTHSFWLSESDLAFTKAQKNNRFWRQPRATLSNAAFGQFRYGDVNQYLFERYFSQNIIGLELKKGGRVYVQWIAPISVDCREELRTATSF